MTPLPEPKLDTGSDLSVKRKRIKKKKARGPTKRDSNPEAGRRPGTAGRRPGTGEAEAGSPLTAGRGRKTVSALLTVLPLAASASGHAVSGQKENPGKRAKRMTFPL